MTYDFTTIGALIGLTAAIGLTSTTAAVILYII